MKKLAGILLAVCILFSWSITVIAASLDETAPSDSVVIGASVPDVHTITVDAEGAEVYLEGKIGTEFTVDRMSKLSLLIWPKANKTVSGVMLNGTDVTGELSGGYISVQSVCEDLQLSVMTTDDDLPEDGSFKLMGVVVYDDKPLAGATLELHSTPKTCITDAKGEFVFDNVEYGHHTMTILKDSTVIGYSEFTVESDENITIENGELGKYELSLPEKSKGLSIVVNLSDDGKLLLSDAKEIGQSQDLPSTSEMNNMVLLLVSLLVSGSGLIILYIIRHHKKTNCK